MRRGGWRGILVVILAVAMVAVLAPASMAKKGGVPGPPDSLTVEALDAVRDHPFYWVDSVVDVKGEESGTLIWATPSQGGTISVDFPYDLVVVVAEADLWGSDGAALPDFVVEFTVEVGAAQASAVQSHEILWLDDVTGEFDPNGDLTSVHLMKDCREVGLTENPDGTYSGTVSELCIWDDPTPGIWSVELTNTGDRSARLLLSLRDHAPGNWCVTNDGTLGSLPEGRVKPGGSITGQISIPADGYCARGGAGGDMMAVGTLHKFVMFTAAEVQLTHEGP